MIITKSRLAKFFKGASLVFVALQLSLPNPSLALPHKEVLSATLLFLAITSAALQQYFMVEVRNGSLIYPIIIFSAAVLGGLNDYLNTKSVTFALHISSGTGQTIRSYITLLSLGISQYAKTLFPSTTQDILSDVKKDITTSS